MHELYRVSRRPYLIAARPPDLAFNFLRTDYGIPGSSATQHYHALSCVVRMSVAELSRHSHPHGTNDVPDSQPPQGGAQGPSPTAFVTESLEAYPAAHTDAGQGNHLWAVRSVIGDGDVCA